MTKTDLFAAVSILAVMTAAGGASAADLVLPSAEADANMSSVPTSDWAGFKLGFGIASEYGADTLFKEDTKVLGTLPMSSVGGFIEGGYDFQAGNFVFGVTANYDMLSTSAEFAKSSKTTITETLGNGWALGARAGLLANESTLVFGSAGYTQRALSLNYTKYDNADHDNVDLSNDFDETLTGYYVGAGVETELTDNLSLKAEYRFSQFDGFTATDITKSSKNLVSDGFDTHQVRLSLDWSF